VTRTSAQVTASAGRARPPGAEHGETIQDGLRREVFEETGLKIEPGSLTGVYQNMQRHIVALVFRCEPVGGDVAENAEAAAFRWATPEEVSGLMTDAYAVRVLDALALGTPPPCVRAHDGTHLLDAVGRNQP
jgi:8-oxo-dGTP diphosphatase